MHRGGFCRFSMTRYSSDKSNLNDLGSHLTNVAESWLQIVDAVERMRHMKAVINTFKVVAIVGNCSNRDDPERKPMHIMSEKAKTWLFLVHWPISRLQKAWSRSPHLIILRFRSIAARLLTNELAPSGMCTTSSPTCSQLSFSQLVQGVGSCCWSRSGCFDQDVLFRTSKQWSISLQMFGMFFFLPHTLCSVTLPRGRSGCGEQALQWHWGDCSPFALLGAEGQLERKSRMAQQQFVQQHIILPNLNFEWMRLSFFQCDTSAKLPSCSFKSTVDGGDQAWTIQD